MKEHPPAVRLSSPDAAEGRIDPILNPPEGFFADLNPEQRRAVGHGGGPVLVLAGAGTGKTRVLTHRIAYLIEEGQAPASILAVTFTNKAAGEMRDRTEKLVGPRAKFCWIGTFHSISARILRRECEALGFKPNFTIYDADDQKRLLKKVMKHLGLSERQTPLGVLHARISSAKNQLITPEQYRKTSQEYFVDRIVEAYEAYQAELARANAFDFDDLIMKAVELFRNVPHTGKAYRERFRHILVDEYQDTNMAQFHWVRLLAEEHRNITVVGDDDQSIYGWRGADLRNLLSFEEHFPGAAVYKLEQNYRSTPEILEAANSLIANNRLRKGKNLWTKKSPGEKVAVYRAEDEAAEAEAVASDIERGRKKKSCSDYCILYRTNAQSRALEDALRMRGIPYVIIGGLRFYERKEVKDILAYLCVMVNPTDDLSLGRIINVPRRGIGERTVEVLTEYAMDQRIPLVETLGRADQISGIHSGAIERLAAFHRLILELRASAKTFTPSQFVRQIIERINYQEELSGEPEEILEDRLRNVNELARAVEVFCSRSEDPTLEGFLAEVSLLSDIDEWDENKNAVSLMTVHCAKGLEFPVVYVTGLEQGLFPILRNLDGEEDLEEERRLFYVALTRARKRAVLYYTHSRRRFGSEMAGRPSMFIAELDAGALERHDLEEMAAPAQKRSAPRDSAMPRYEDFSQEEKTFRVGGYVRHPSWGNGKIISVSGFGMDAKLTILFGGIQKKVAVRYANLEIL